LQLIFHISLFIYRKHFLSQDKIPVIFSVKLINANGYQYTNLHRRRVEITKTTNLFKVIRKGVGNKMNRSMFNRRQKGSQHTRRILLLYLGALLLSRSSLVIFVCYCYFCGKQSWTYTKPGATHGSCYAIYAAFIVKVQRLSSDRGISSNEK